MAIRLFVDTLFIVALVNPRDQHHKLALALSYTFENSPLLITDAVILEIGNALAKDHRAKAVEVITGLLSSDESEVVRLTPGLFERGLALFKQHRDKAWGLVDCISFVAMREAAVPDALTSDRHFAQAGFRPMMIAGAAG